MEVTVGLVSICQDSFTGDKKQVMNEAIAGLEELSQDYNFNLVAWEELVKSERDAEDAKEFMENNNADFVLVQNSSFAPGTLAPVIAEGNYGFGLWGRPETRDNGKLPLNSFCGSNMNASVLGYKEQETEQKFKFKWFYGDVDGELFLPRFEVTLRAMQAVKKLSNLKIGLVIGTAPGFANLEFDPDELKARFGIEVEVIDDFDSLLADADNIADDRVEAEVERTREQANEVRVEDKFLEKSARYYLALKDLAEEKGIDTYALRCWPDTNQKYGIFPCSVVAKLNEDGMAASCEGDVYGAINQTILNALTGKNSMLLDMSDIDLTRDRLLLWHCGNVAGNFAKEGKYNLDHQFNSDGLGTVHDLVIQPMHSTVLSMMQNGEKIFTFEGNFIDAENESFHGSRGWFTDLEIGDEKIEVKDLVNTIYAHNLPHHYAVCEGDYTAEIKELSYWLDLDLLPQVPYSNTVR